MYISRKGLVDDLGARGTIKSIFFDIESMLLVMGKDTQSIAFDVLEELNEIRWSIFLHKMRSSGILPESELLEASNQQAAGSRQSSFASSIANMIFFR